ncbi:MAG: hypothetical protein ACJATN_002318 [Neolewinella sp.]
MARYWLPEGIIVWLVWKYVMFSVIWVAVGFHKFLELIDKGHFGIISTVIFFLVTYVKANTFHPPVVYREGCVAVLPAKSSVLLTSGLDPLAGD